MGLKFPRTSRLFPLLFIYSHSLLAAGPIAYTDVGQGTPLLLIHAFPADQQLWEPQQNALKAHFRVITLDLRGFGESAPVDGQAIGMTDYADEVKALLDQLHIDKAIIGGESMGGYIALAFLEKYPQHVEGLILSNTQSIADNQETKAKRESSAQDILENGTAGFIQGFLPKALSANTSEQNKAFLLGMLNHQSAPAMASALRGMALRDDRSDTLANTSLPVLIITSDEDKLIPPLQSKNMHKLARNSKLVTLADAGHLSNLEQPALWNQAVEKMFYK